MKPRIVSVVGTRPEVIKMAPVIKHLQNRSDRFEHVLVATAQHREMLDQILLAFDLKPDIDLDLMKPDQELAQFAARSLESLSRLFSELKPDAILIQGDTTTVMTAALAGFYLGIKVGHVESGLRSFDSLNPFPEEINRRIAGTLADFHFAPTERARLNLLHERVSADRIFVTGNTVVDALKSIDLGKGFSSQALSELNLDDSRLLLVTAHRRENHGAPLESICRALKRIVSEFDDVQIIYPVHLNPNVKTIVDRELSGIERIHLIEPLSYIDMLKVMERCYMLLSDSGGVQEEAPSFHKPVLVLREVTERPEVVDVNAGKLVGTDEKRVLEAARHLLTDVHEYVLMSSAPNPFGDGHAAERIVDILDERLR